MYLHADEKYKYILISVWLLSKTKTIDIILSRCGYNVVKKITINDKAK